MHVLAFQLRLLLSRLFCGGRSVARLVLGRLLFLVVVLLLDVTLRSKNVFAVPNPSSPRSIPLRASVYGFDAPLPLFIAVDQ